MVLLVCVLPTLTVGAGEPSAEEPGRGDFLVAARHLDDPNFAKTVVLIVQHTSVGSLGVIVNRPTGIPVSEAIKALSEFADQDHKLYFGGPVSPQAMNYVTRRAPPGPSMELATDVHLGGSRDDLRTLLREGLSKRELRIFGGYAGWSPGQLRTEQARGDWHRVPASADQVFAANPHRVWSELIDRLEPRGLLTRAGGFEAVQAKASAEGLASGLGLPR